MDLKPHQSDPTKLAVKWEEEDLRVIAAAYTEKIGLQLEESVEDEVSDLDIAMARSFTDRQEHLSEDDEIPCEWVEGMSVTLREFSQRSNEQARAAARRNGAPYYTNGYIFDRLELGKKALRLAKQFEDPQTTAIIQELEASLELPLPGDTRATLELPAASDDTS
jgi:hypothetical protein